MSPLEFPSFSTNNRGVTAEQWQAWTASATAACKSSKVMCRCTMCHKMVQDGTYTPLLGPGCSTTFITRRVALRHTTAQNIKGWPNNGPPPPESGSGNHLDPQQWMAWQVDFCNGKCDAHGRVAIPTMPPPLEAAAGAAAAELDSQMMDAEGGTQQPEVRRSSRRTNKRDYASMNQQGWGVVDGAAPPGDGQQCSHQDEQPAALLAELPAAGVLSGNTVQDVAWGRTAREWADKLMIGRWAEIDHNIVSSEQDLLSRVPSRDDGGKPVSSQDLVSLIAGESSGLTTWCRKLSSTNPPVDAFVYAAVTFDAAHAELHAEDTNSSGDGGPGSTKKAEGELCMFLQHVPLQFTTMWCHGCA